MKFKNLMCSAFTFLFLLIDFGLMAQSGNEPKPLVNENNTLSLQLPCEDCCEIGMLVSTAMGFDSLISVALPENYNAVNADPITRSILRSSYHSGITINGSIYDFGLGLSSWRIIQKKLQVRTVSDLMATPEYERRLEKENYYHMIFTVPNSSCKVLKKYWEEINKTRPRYNVKTSNCHIMVVEGLLKSFDANTNINQYFFKDDHENNRWGVLNFRKAYEQVRSNCGSQLGQKPKLVIYKSGNNNSGLGKVTNEEGGCAECNPTVYDNPCDPIIRLDLGSGTDLTIDVEITLGSEISPIGFLEKYETTFTELMERSSGRFQSSPQTFTLQREDGSLMTNKFVGGVDFTDLKQASSLGKILPANSYDLITCAHPDPAAGVMPNIQQVYDLLKEGGEFRIALYDFDYYSPIATAMVKEIDRLFTNVQKTQILENRYALRRPPMVSINDFVVSGIKKTRPPALKKGSLNSESHFAIYPNPATNIFNIEGLEENTEIEIYNTLGIMVKTIEISTPSVNIEELKPGLYVVKIVSEENSYTQLLKIER